MNKWLSVLLIITLLVIGNISCSSHLEIRKSLVQVFEIFGHEDEKIIMSFGLAVGDGSQILTVINYEGDFPGSLAVGKPGGNIYSASVLVIDPRTSVTLLKIEDAVFTPAKVDNTGILTPGNEILLHGWIGPDYKKLKTQKTNFPGYDKAFSIDIQEGPYINSPGAVVTDKNGNIIGIIGTFYDAFVIRPGPPGMTAPIINMQDAIELLSPDVVDQPWAKGPAYALVQSPENAQGHRLFSEPPKSKYTELTIALESLFNTLGEPLPLDQLPDNYRSYLYGLGENKPDGALLGLIYPGNVDLKNAQGEVLAKAKWVGIQWNRSEGKPNRILYGVIDQFRNAVTIGGFVLNGDITELEKAIN